jgi:prepilin-type N-terminal cleavage/methylation domain-containing protein
MRRLAPQTIGTPRGYTLVELVVVMAVMSILAAYVAPRFWDQPSFSQRGYADELAAALRSTQKAAVITDCPARLTLSATSYSATQQAALNNTCNTASTRWTTTVESADGSAVSDTAPSSTTASPAGVYQFDGQGRLSSSPGTTITVGTHTITIVPASGLVQVN